MPYINLQIQPAPTPQQAAVLAQGITDAMVEVAGKRREVTAVHIAAADAALWTIAGEASTVTTAYLDVKITAGTNSREEKAALLQRLHRLLVDALGELAEASYIVIHELPAEDWGYAGLSQAARAGGHL
ncbi:MAG: tautomerase family protein [Chromatiales bacterium]|jgi:4-oxalocrotonate tautomerase